MKTQIRRGVFETNSSSTHSLSLNLKSDYDRFLKGEMVIDYNGKLNELTDPDVIKYGYAKGAEFTEDDDIYDYEYFDAEGWDMYCDACNYEVLDEEMNGVIALSIYGGDC